MKTLTVAALIVALVSARAAAAAVQLKKAGKLSPPANVSLMAFCSDPTVEAVLSQDFRAAKRAADADAKAVTTLTVTVTQQVLKPGVSMSQIAPGAPEVADLLKAAGATPPPLGDTGSEVDSGVRAQLLAQRQVQPGDSPLSQVLNQFAAHGNLAPENAPCDPSDPSPQPGCVQPTPKPKPGSPGYTGDTEDYLNRDNPLLQPHGLDDKAFQTVVVARASLSGSADELTVVAVVEPGGDVIEAKKLVAEEITDAVLH
ncbi:MAG TPA: hypothetical protein VKS22_07160 [Candidatus Binataceae bacterium]|nr:hypothetical protein [Candidatus Binataceae bacterium]